MQKRISAVVALLFALVGWSPGSAVAAPFGLLYTHPLEGDEDTRFATFLGEGVLMLGEFGPGSSREARVYEADSGAFKFGLACPPYEPSDDLASERCPTAVSASGRLFAVKGSHELHVFERSGAFLRTIAPLEPPSGYDPFVGGLAVRGRRIAVAGPLFEDGAVAPAVVIYLFDGVTGALVRHFVVASPEPLCGVALEFVGRRLVAGLPGCPGTSELGRVLAIDSSTGAVLWSRNAPVPTAGDRFGSELAALGSDVVVGPGAHRLDGRTGLLEQSYSKPGGGSYTSFDDIAASGRRVAVASFPPSTVHVFSADTGALLQIVEPPHDLCDVFGTEIGLSSSRLLATAGSYCGSGEAFVFRMP